MSPAGGQSANGLQPEVAGPRCEPEKEADYCCGHHHPFDYCHWVTVGLLAGTGRKTGK